MKKIFVAATVGLLFSLTPAVNAEVAPSNVVQKPDDAKTRQNLAAAWHELGKLHYAAKNYTDALAAFEKAVERATTKFNGLG